MGSRLARDGIPLTVCPCSNHRLQVNRRFFGGENPTRQLLTKGLKVTLNSDDPAYFFGHTDKYGKTHGGYVDSCSGTGRSTQHCAVLPAQNPA